jgi:hypothetical protein
MSTTNIMDRLLMNELGDHIVTGSGDGGYYRDIDIYGDGVLAGEGYRRKRKRKPSAFNIAVRNYMKQHGVTLAEAAHALAGKSRKRKPARRRRRRGGVGIGMMDMTEEDMMGQGMYGGVRRKRTRRSAPSLESKIQRDITDRVIKQMAMSQYCKEPPKDATKKQLVDYYAECTPIGEKARRDAYKKGINKLIKDSIRKPGADIEKLVNEIVSEYMYEK